MRTEQLSGLNSYGESTTYTLHTFDSLNEFCELTTCEATSGGSQFYDYVTLAQAKSLALNGWPEGLEKLKQFSGKLENVASHSIAKQDLFYDVTGLDWDMGLAVTGNSECWYDFSPKDETKTIRMAYNVNVSGGMSQEQMQLRGAAIAALVDLLEANNIRVELDVYGTLNYAYRYQHTMMIPIKAASQHLDLDRIAFVFMHAGMSRKLTFSYCKTVCGGQESGGIGWGIKPDLTSYDLDISGGHIGLPEYASVTNMLTWIKDRLKDFGVHMNTGDQS